MVGYPETMTDPSYAGQILVFTYPLMGTTEFPGKEEEYELLKYFESNKIHLKGIVIHSLSRDFSHWNGKTSLEEWMKEHKIPGIEGIDTRALTQKLRDEGTQLATLLPKEDSIEFYDPSKDNLVAQVSIDEPKLYKTEGSKKEFFWLILAVNTISYVLS